MGTPDRRRSVPYLLPLAIALAPVGALSHPTSDQDQVRYALLQWANGVANASPDAVAPLLHADFRLDLGPIRLSRAQYLGVMGAEGPLVERVSLAHAFHEETADGRVVVRPVVQFYREELSSPMALAVELVRDDGRWKLVKISQGGELPPALMGPLPERATLHTVKVRVTDAATGAPVAARVHVEDDQGEYWPPQGHQKNIPTGWRQDVGRDVTLAGRTYAYVEPAFELPLPEGDYSLDLARGMQYVPKKVEFSVAAGKVPALQVAIERWSDVQRQGWYSGDTHVHFLDPQSALLEMRGEDLNVLNILATKWGELITNVEHFTGKPSPLSTPDHQVFVGEETRHGFLGHTILLEIERLVYPLTWGGPVEGVPGGYDETTMAAQADRAHAAGGFVAWAHFPGPGGELPADLALGKLDSVDIMTWGDAFQEGGATGPPGAVETWYRFLNCGFRVPATAGTDKMLNTQVSGSVRTYVHVDGAFSYAAWLDGIRAGRTFVTTGPVLKLRAGKHGIGDEIAAKPGDRIRVAAEVASLLPVEWLEIVVSGEVVARVDNPDARRELSLEAEVPVSSSAWIAARAYSPTMQPYQRWIGIGATGVPVMAHTSPIYVAVPGAPQRSAEDAQFLTNWLDRSAGWVEQQGRFHSPAEREALTELLERAKAVYLEQVR